MLACNLCGSERFVPVYSARDYITNELQMIVRCEDCGLVFVNPQPGDIELTRYYPASYHGTKPFLYEKIDNLLRTKRLVRMNTRHRIILDIGCGKGMLLSSLQRKGWEVWGTELSDESAQYAKTGIGINVLKQNIQNCEFTANYFDIITMFHSLEHIKDPKDTLRAINKILKEDGVLLIEVPKFDSIYARIFKDKWFHLDVPRHLYHFEEKTIKSLLKATGFSITKMRKFSFLYDVLGNVQSVLNCLCSRMNILSDFSAKRLTLKSIRRENKQKRLLFDVFLSNCLFPILFIFMAFVSLALMPINVGGTLIVYAEKITGATPNTEKSP